MTALKTLMAEASRERFDSARERTPERVNARLTQTARWHIPCASTLAPSLSWWLSPAERVLSWRVRFLQVRVRNARYEPEAEQTVATSVSRLVRKPAPDRTTS